MVHVSQAPYFELKEIQFKLTCLLIVTHLCGNLYMCYAKSNYRNHNLTSVPKDISATEIRLDLQNNEIANIEVDAFKNLVNLKTLNLGNNIITNIKESSWNNLHNLEYLFLNNNEITNIEERAFKNVPKLKYLILSYNKITNIKENSWNSLLNLQLLNLDHNKITNIKESSWEHLLKLEYLYLSYNNITNIKESSWNNLLNLQELLLNNNEITNIEEGAVNNVSTLKHIDLRYNKITNIKESSLKNLLNLQELLLNNNEIMNIEEGAFKDVPNLLSLILSYNKITNIKENSWNNLLNLQELYLKYNEIMYIEPGAFKTLRSLNILHLEGNRLSEISSATFEHLPSLRSLNLNNNKISKYDDGAFLLLSNINEIDLRNNTDMICGCQIPAFVYFIKRTYNRHVNVLGYCHTVLGNNQTKLIATQDPSHCKSYSLFPHKMRCQTCLGINCSDSEETICPYPESVCMSITSMSGATLKIEKSCSTYRDCVEAERNNTFTCNKWTSGTSCSACCTGYCCNSNDLIDWTKSFVLNMLYTMTSDIWSRNLDKYGIHSESISRAMEHEFLTLTGAFTVKYCGLQQKIAIFTIYCRVLSEMTVEQLKQDIYNILNTSKTLRNFGIQRDNIELIDKMLCNESTTSDNDYTLAWPVTKVGNTVTIPCHGNVATRRCSSRTEEVHLEMPPTQCLTSPDHSPFTGVWEEPDMSQCNNTDWITRGLKDRKSQVIDKDNIEDLSKQLLNISQKSVYFKEKHINLAMDIYEKLVPWISNMSANTTTNYILSINNMINTPETILAEAEQSNRNVNRMLDIIGTISKEIRLEEQQLTVLYSNLGIGVTKVEKDTFNGRVYGISCATNETVAHSTIYKSSYPDQQLEDITMMDYISLPNSLLRHLKEEELSTISRITFFSLPNDKLYRIIQTSGNKTNSTIEPFINSRIMAANIPNIPITNLDEPVTMSFSLLHKNASNPKCVYWDETPGHWSTKGCNTYNMVPGEKVSCSCNHLTSFAILMDVYQNEVTVKNLKPLSIISNIGCGISFVFLVLTVIFHVCFKDLWKIFTSKILVNYCSSLAVTNLIFLVGMQSYATKTIAGCKAVAALLHYFLLVSIMWMTVEALHICLAVIVLSKTYQSSFMMRSSIFAWGLPVVIVILTLAINYTNNYIRITEVCWLSRTSFYAAFLMPVVIILLFNLTIFSLVIWRLISMQYNKTFEHKTRKVRVFGIVGLFFLLGLTWMLAFFTFGEATIVFKYLFAIFNTLQGLFVFIFYCMYKKDSRDIICKNLRKRMKYESGASSGNETERRRDGISEDKTSQTKL